MAAGASVSSTTWNSTPACIGQACTRTFACERDHFQSVADEDEKGSPMDNKGMLHDRWIAIDDVSIKETAPG